MGSTYPVDFSGKYVTDVEVLCDWLTDFIMRISRSTAVSHYKEGYYEEFFKELFDMKSKEVENVTPPKDTEMEVQTKTSLADRYNNWWERENAKAFCGNIPYMVRGYFQ